MIDDSVARAIETKVKPLSPLAVAGLCLVCMVAMVLLLDEPYDKRK